MAEFKAVQLKRSTTAGAVPSTAQLVEGELAINLADKRLYSKNSTGVFEIIGGIDAATLAYINSQVEAYLGTIAMQDANNVAITGGTISGVAITSSTVNGQTLGSNAQGNKTVSTSAPSGGSDGDIWYRV